MYDITVAFDSPGTHARSLPNPWCDLLGGRYNPNGGQRPQCRDALAVSHVVLQPPTWSGVWYKRWRGHEVKISDRMLPETIIEVRLSYVGKLSFVMCCYEMMDVIPNFQSDTARNSQRRFHYPTVQDYSRPQIPVSQHNGNLFRNNEQWYQPCGE